MRRNSCNARPPWRHAELTTISYDDVANTRTVNVWSTHLSVNSAGERLSELSNLQACASQWSEARILAGDFNMQVSSPEYAAATVSYVDAWDLARANGLTINC